MLNKDNNGTMKSNSLGYLLLKHKNYIPVFLALTTIVLGTIGFCIDGKSVTHSILDSIKLFGLDFPADPNNTQIAAIIFSVITITFTITLVFIKDSLDKWQLRRNLRKDHIAIFGLGEASTSFLVSYSKENRKERIVIIESDPNNTKLEEYRNLGYGVLVGDSLSESTLQRLKLNKMKYAIIAMGSDSVNIELAKMILSKYNQEKVNAEVKLIVHILNRDLDSLFIQNTKLSDHKKDDENPDARIEIKTFSFFNEAAEDLFENYPIDGDDYSYIDSNSSLNTIIVGNGELIKSVIYQMALISHFPNENLHTVHIVHKNANELLGSIQKHIYYRVSPKDNFPNFKLVAVPIDSNTLNYYDDPIWLLDNLVNVIIANDNQNENLDLAMELFNRTYLAKSRKKEDHNMPKIIFAMYDPLALNDIINNDIDDFNNFHTFGNSERVLSYSNLLEEDKYILARLIHSKYVENSISTSETITDKSVGENVVRDNWFDLTEYSDKLSSIAQTQHIDIKLKSMRLKKVAVLDDILEWKTKSSTKKCKKLHKEEIVSIIEKVGLHKYKNKKIRLEAVKDVLLDWNKDQLLEVFEEYRTKLNIGDKELLEYFNKPDESVGTNGKVSYFPDSYDTLFEKMIRMEHNRWNAYNFANGWKYSENKAKEIKEHNCLIPLKDFATTDMQKTVKYDIISFLFLPYYLSEVGYAIVPLEYAK